MGEEVLERGAWSRDSQEGRQHTTCPERYANYILLIESLIGGMTNKKPRQYTILGFEVLTDEDLQRRPPYMKSRANFSRAACAV